MDILVSSLFVGLLIGMVLAIILVYIVLRESLMEIVNFAHGEFLMVGMYTGLLTAQATGMEPLLTLPVAAVAGFLLGVICYFGFIKFLIRGPMVAQLLGTFGLMIFLRNLALLFFGAEDRAIHQGILVGKSFDIGMGIIAPATKLAAAALSVIAFWAVWLVINRTKIGKALTATSLNWAVVVQATWSIERMNALAWGIGGGTVTIAGALLVNFWSVNPFMGLLFTMIAFAIVALGGFGSVTGAFFAGLLVGVITEIPGIWDFLTYIFNFGWMADVPMTSLKYMWVYLAYFVIMIVRPRGLFGWKR